MVEDVPAQCEVLCEPSSGIRAANTLLLAFVSQAIGFAGVAEGFLAGFGGADRLLLLKEAIVCVLAGSPGGGDRVGSDRDLAIDRRDVFA